MLKYLSIFVSVILSCISIKLITQVVIKNFGMYYSIIQRNKHSLSFYRTGSYDYNYNMFCRYNTIVVYSKYIGYYIPQICLILTFILAYMSK